MPRNGPASGDLPSGGDCVTQDIHGCSLPSVAHVLFLGNDGWHPRGHRGGGGACAFRALLGIEDWVGPPDGGGGLFLVYN
jgi:hypothetical protein